MEQTRTSAMPGVPATDQTKTSWWRVLRLAGAFVAFMIGSGFATGQEVMQFFTAYGIWSIGGLIIAMVLFAWSGKVFMNYGFRHRNDETKLTASSGFQYYAGKYAGIFLEWFVPVFLFLVVVVMISGAGATVAQYFGAPQWVGSVGMIVLVYIANLFGLKRIVDIIGALGPVTILFTLAIAAIALIQNTDGLANLAEKADTFASMPNATNGSQLWWLAGLLYVAYNVTGSIPFFTETGAMATTAKEAKYGAIIGAVALIGSGLVLNLALLSYIDDVKDLQVPNLFLAELFHPVIGALFALILLDEIFSTAAPMLWIASSRIGKEGTTKFKIALTVLALIALLGGQLPFGMVLGIVYPYTGYLGIIVLILVGVRQVVEWRNRKRGLPVEAPLSASSTATS